MYNPDSGSRLTQACTLDGMFLCYCDTGHQIVINEQIVWSNLICLSVSLELDRMPLRMEVGVVTVGLISWPALMGD